MSTENENQDKLRKVIEDYRAVASKRAYLNTAITAAETELRRAENAVDGIVEDMKAGRIRG